MTTSFTGHIAGIGTASGVRIVIGIWDASPYGTFADAMVEDASGHRTLIAPRQDVANFVSSTYQFDEVLVEPVHVERGTAWSLHARSLQVRVTPGRRLWIAPALRLVPSPVRRTESWARVCNPIVRRLIPGVQTHGSAGDGRTEWYAARDARTIAEASATWHDEELGALAPVSPPVRFGFASAPERPTLTTLTAYIR